MNARSREGSRSPPALAHFAREAFFGSSFAGNGLVQNKPIEKQEASGFKQNTFVLSNVHRVQVGRHSSPNMA